MIQILQKTTTQPDHTRTYLSALFHFIDNILQVPSDLTNKLKEDITPFINEDGTRHMLADKRNPSQTLAGIFEELKEEGMEKGRKEAAKDFAEKLIRKDFTNDQITELTKLDLEEVVELRKSLQM